jgi:hypothetical protein
MAKKQLNIQVETESEGVASEDQSLPLQEPKRNEFASKDAIKTKLTLNLEKVNSHN